MYTSCLYPSRDTGPGRLVWPVLKLLDCCKSPATAIGQVNSQSCTNDSARHFASSLDVADVWCFMLVQEDKVWTARLNESIILTRCCLPLLQSQLSFSVRDVAPTKRGDETPCVRAATSSGVGGQIHLYLFFEMQTFLSVAGPTWQFSER